MSAQTQALWTLADVAAAVEGAAFGVAEANITGVSIDTRTLQPGDLFIALKGPNFDGNGFTGAAAAAGAAAALVEARPGAGYPLATIAVADTQAGLERLGRAARARTDARVVAVTGVSARHRPRKCSRRPWQALARPIGPAGASIITGVCRSVYRGCQRAHALGSLSWA